MVLNGVSDLGADDRPVACAPVCLEHHSNWAATKGVDAPRNRALAIGEPVGFREAMPQCSAHRLAKWCHSDAGEKDFRDHRNASNPHRTAPNDCGGRLLLSWIAMMQIRGMRCARACWSVPPHVEGGVQADCEVDIDQAASSW